MRLRAIFCVLRQYVFIDEHKRRYTMIPTPNSNNWGLFGLVEFDKPAPWAKAVTMLADIANCTLK